MGPLEQYDHIVLQSYVQADDVFKKSRWLKEQRATPRTLEANYWNDEWQVVRVVSASIASPTLFSAAQFGVWEFGSFLPSHSTSCCCVAPLSPSIATTTPTTITGSLYHYHYHTTMPKTTSLPLLSRLSHDDDDDEDKDNLKTNAGAHRIGLDDDDDDHDDDAFRCMCS